MIITKFVDRDCASIIFDYFDYSSIVEHGSYLFENLPFFLKWKLTFFGAEQIILKPLAFTRSKCKPKPYVQIDSNLVIQTGPVYLSQIIANYFQVSYTIRFMIQPIHNIADILKRVYVTCFRFRKQNPDFFRNSKRILIVNVRKAKDDELSEMFEQNNVLFNNPQQLAFLPLHRKTTMEYSILTPRTTYYNMRLQITQCSHTKITLRCVGIQKTMTSKWESILE